MSRFLLRAGFAFALVGLTLAAPFAQSQAPSGYLMPPKVIADIMDAEPLPGVAVSPDRRTLLLIQPDVLSRRQEDRHRPFHRHRHTLARGRRRHRCGAHGP